jgi:DNA-binding MarR family transcriptional regulator
MSIERKEKYEDIEIWKNFLVYHKDVTSRIETSLKRSDCISLAWYDILIVIERSKEKNMTMKELIDETVLTKSGVSKILDRIEEGKLISRKKSHLDARSVFIAITKEGSLEVRKAWSIYKKCIEDFFLATLSTSEKTILKTVLIKLRSKLE